MNRRTVAGICLFVSPILHAVSYALWPAHDEGSPTGELVAARLHPGGWAAATLTEAVGWLVLLPALVYLWSQIRGRGSVLVSIGTWLVTLGVFGFFGSTVLNLVTIDLAAQPSGQAVYETLRADGRLAAVVVLPLLLGVVSLVVLLAGLARAGWAAWWQVALGAVGVVASEALPNTGNPLVLIAAFAPMAVALAALGARLLSQRSAPATVAQPVPAAA